MKYGPCSIYVTIHGIDERPQQQKIAGDFQRV